MTKGGWGNVLRSVHALLDEGVVGDLTDRELLERYGSGGGESAESAFAALVERHGAMVLRVCRVVLRDEHAAQDAFQATFLVLARKARSLWVRDSLGPWLHGVAYRTLTCSRAAAARRRTHERRAAEQSDLVREGIEPDDLVPILHDELNRLPERLRAPVVLCYLDGLTHEQAAERLRCPVGTVRSRLSTGREHLRRRLERRGFSSSEGVMASALGGSTTSGPVPVALAEAAVRIGQRLAAGSTVAGVVPASVLVLMEGGMKTMWYSRLMVLSIALLAIGGGAIGALALAQLRPGGEPPVTPAKPVSGSLTAQDARRQPLRPVNEPARRALLEAPSRPPVRSFENKSVYFRKGRSASTK